MEIHPPEKPIHTFKDFLLQLMTITIGILIALSLEGLLEWSHHRTLVREAKENLRQEMLDNKKGLEKFVASLPALKSNEDEALRLIGDLRAHRKSSVHTLNFTYEVALLSSTSWSAAQAAGAIAFMPYRDVQRYATIYDLQRKLDGMQDRLFESLIAAEPSQDPDNASSSALREWEQHIHTSRTTAKNVEDWARGLLAEYDKALR